MQLPDMVKEQLGHAFRVDRRVCRYEVCTLAQTVDDVHDGIVTVCVRQLDDEVDADRVPSFIRCLEWVELTSRWLTQGLL